MAAVVVVRVAIGHLADRYVARRVAMFRWVGWAVAVLLLLAAVFSAQPVSVPLLLIAAVASMTWNPVMFTVSVAVVPPERVGVTQGALTAVIFLAGGLAPILTAAVVTAYSWSVAWSLLAAISVFGALIMSSVAAAPARDGGQSR
jgi:MFS family permease